MPAHRTSSTNDNDQIADALFQGLKAGVTFDVHDTLPGCIDTKHFRNPDAKLPPKVIIQTTQAFLWAEESALRLS